MKPKMTTAVKTRRTRGKRWGYEGINSLFRGVDKVYPSKPPFTRHTRTNVRMFLLIARMRKVVSQ